MYDFACVRVGGVDATTSVLFFLQSRVPLSVREVEQVGGEGGGEADQVEQGSSRMRGTLERRETPQGAAAAALTVAILLTHPHLLLDRGTLEPEIIGTCLKILHFSKFCKVTILHENGCKNIFVCGFAKFLNETLLTSE